MVRIIQSTVWIDEFKQAFKTTGDFGEQLPPSVKDSDHVILGRHQGVLDALPREKVTDDIVVHFAGVPHEDEILRSESAALEHARELPGINDWHAAREAIVDAELIFSMLIARGEDLHLQLVDWDGELEPVVDDRVPGYQVRDVD